MKIIAISVNGTPMKKLTRSISFIASLAEECSLNLWRKKVQMHRDITARMAADHIRGFLENKGCSVGIVAIPDTGNMVYLSSVSGLCVDREQFAELKNRFLLKYPEFQGVIYADTWLGCISNAAFGTIPEKIYETVIA